MKHIKMPKELATKWLAALRSGEYVQGQRYLYMKEPERFCCLGVLEHCVSGSVEVGKTPSFNWLEKHEIIFLNEDGHSNGNPYIGSWGLSAAAANDGGKSFEEIAKELEKEIEFTDEDNKSEQQN